MIAKKYLEYVLSAKTMNSRSYSPSGMWRVGKKKGCVMGRLPKEVKIALAIDLETACAFQTIRNNEIGLLSESEESFLSDGLIMNVIIVVLAVKP